MLCKMYVVHYELCCARNTHSKHKEFASKLYMFAAELYFPPHLYTRTLFHLKGWKLPSHWAPDPFPTAPTPAESLAPSSMGLVFSEVVSLNLRLLSPSVQMDTNPEKHGPKPQLILDSPPHPSTASVHAESIAASRVEQALSEVASSLSSYQPKPGPHQAWLLQIQIWLLTAQLYLK